MSRPGGQIQKISVSIAGHSTSISLEAAFLAALRQLALDQGQSVAALIAQIDAARGEANLSSAIRVFLLDYFRSRADQAPRAAQDAVEPTDGPA